VAPSSPRDDGWRSVRGGMGLRQDGRPTLAIHEYERSAGSPHSNLGPPTTPRRERTPSCERSPESKGIRGVAFLGPKGEVRVEGGVMDEPIQSRQRPREQFPSSEEEWRQRLSPEQFEVLRNKGTEQAFTGTYAFTKDPGTYRCAASRTVPFRGQVRLGHRLAQLPRADRSGSRRASRGSQLRHAPNRGTCAPVRRPPGPSLR
jgi:hypothetical protein